MIDSREINKLFCEKGLTLGSVESFTGGLFAQSITAFSGASRFYKGGLVTYATEEKVRLLGICQTDVDKYGVISKEIAYQMAEKGRESLDVDYCISFTGNAGPGAMEGKQVGEVYIGIADKNNVETYAFLLKGSRQDIQNEGVKNALEILKKKIS